MAVSLVLQGVLLRHHKKLDGDGIVAHRGKIIWLMVTE